MQTLVTIYKDARGQWRWRLRDGRNHKIIGASTESYTARRSCVRNLERVTLRKAPAARRGFGSSSTVWRV